jgi:VanZ family protein
MAAGWSVMSMFRKFVLFIWLASLAIWTWKLLDPKPIPPSLQPEETLAYLLAKSLHVSGYTWITFLGLWLWKNLTLRICFVGFMVWHGIATEIIQSYIPTRSGSPKDVGFDTFGITVACLLTYWREKTAYKLN